MKGTDAEGISRLADTRYARWMQLRGTQALSADGTVRRASTAAMLKRRDPRMMLGQRDMDPETADLVNAMKEWGKMGKEMPSSGTAERTAMYNMLKGAGVVGFGGAAIF